MIRRLKEAAGVFVAVSMAATVALSVAGYVLALMAIPMLVIAVVCHYVWGWP